jgi:hypothetical protein
LDDEEADGLHEEEEEEVEEEPLAVAVGARARVVSRTTQPNWSWVVSVRPLLS